MPRQGLRPNGDFIRKARAARIDGDDSFRPTSFAAAVGISYQHLAGIESGRHRAAEDVLRSIAKKLGCSIDNVILGAA